MTQRLPTKCMMFGDRHHYLIVPIHLPHPSPHRGEGHKCEMWPLYATILDDTRLWVALVRNGVIYLKSKVNLLRFVLIKWSEVGPCHFELARLGIWASLESDENVSSVINNSSSTFVDFFPMRQADSLCDSRNWRILNIHFRSNPVRRTAG